MTSSGQVYVVKADNGLSKIGLTVGAGGINHRLASLQQYSPCPLELVCSVSVGDAYTVESKLHNEFADKRLHGEWFNLSQADIAKIKQLLAVYSQECPAKKKTSSNLERMTVYFDTDRDKDLLQAIKFESKQRYIGISATIRQLLQEWHERQQRARAGAESD